MGRIFWFTLGAGAAVYAAVKVHGYLQQATPKAIGHRVSESATGITGRA